MKRLASSLLIFATVATAGLTLAGCAPTSTPQAPSVEVASDTMLIDVRTPAEFAQGHLDGAVNIDWESADFAAQIEGLDKNGTYVLYCHSGRRAGEALSMMQSQGFTNVTNIGGIDEAAATTGLEVVTN